MKRDGPINVLLVDDSMLFRALLTTELARYPDIRVVGGASDAGQARDQILKYHPDVIVLDLELPRTDGLSFLRQLRRVYPVPVVVCSGTTERNGPKALRAMALGAFDVLIKPSEGGRTAREELARALVERVRVADTEARPVAPTVRPSRVPETFRDAGLNPARYLVAVGASTGGTEAILALLSSAPADFPPVVMVQHMPAGFTRSFAERLDRLSPLTVTEAVDGQTLAPGQAVLARGDAHLVVAPHVRPWRVRYTHEGLVNGHQPSVEVLFDAVSAAAGKWAVGILLTGMGADGAHALLRLRHHGALTVAQNRDSCVVYGMPKVAVDIGAAQHSGAPAEIPQLLIRQLAARDGREN